MKAVRRDSLYVRAARGENTQHAPVWFMRQAGRYLPEYLELRAKHSFWDAVRTPELAAEITLQPIRRFGFDAAILFSDIMTPLPAMGVDIEFAPGPVINEPIRTIRAVEALRIPEVEEIAPFVAETVRELDRNGPVPVIGFGGAPLTLAAYLIQGGGSKDFAEFRGFLRAEPAAAHALMDKLADVSIRYLSMQIEAGASAVQVFDSWAGLHGAEVFAEFGVPYLQRILSALASYDVPRVYFALHSQHLIEQVAALPADVFGVDWRRPISSYRSTFGTRTIQGNLDPAILLGGTDLVRREVERVLVEGQGGAHIFNLGHGIHRTTPLDNVAAAVDVIRSFERER